MLSIHYVSIMMRIFYINWQQHWECDRTMNIGANAHGNRTVSTKQPQVTDLTLTSVSPLTVGLPVTSERYWACFQVTRLFHSATIFCCYICICCLKLHRADYQVEAFFYIDLVGEHSAPMSLLFAPNRYWSLGHRGYFGLSNVGLVWFVLQGIMLLLTLIICIVFCSVWSYIQVCLFLAVLFCFPSNAWFLFFVMASFIISW